MSEVSRPYLTSHFPFIQRRFERFSEVSAENEEILSKRSKNSPFQLEEGGVSARYDSLLVVIPTATITGELFLTSYAK